MTYLIVNTVSSLSYFKSLLTFLQGILKMKKSILASIAFSLIAVSATAFANHDEPPCHKGDRDVKAPRHNFIKCMQELPDSATIGELKAKCAPKFDRGDKRAPRDSGEFRGSRDHRDSGEFIPNKPTPPQGF